jgi:nucleoid-associated protein YgaU
MNMSDKKEEDDKKGLLDRFEEAVFPHERKREAAKAEEKAKTEQAEQARLRNEKVQADFEQRRKREAAQQGSPGAGAPGVQQNAPVRGEGAQSVRRHTVQSGETLSHLALKYYGSAARDSWMKIYEANKAIIGDNPNMIKVGQELVIP